MGDTELEPSLEKVAFDHPGTRAAWKTTHRRVRNRLWLWSALFVAAMAVGIVLTPSHLPAGRGNTGPGAPIMGLAVLTYPFALYTCCGALSRLRKARSILEAYPWQPLPAVRRLSGTKEATGVAVQFRLPEGEGEGSGDGTSTYADDDGSVWSQTMSARSAQRWNHWDDAMQRGAWFAGDVERGGVLALPGGAGLMTVQRRARVLAMEGRTARAEHASILAAAPGRD